MSRTEQAHDAVKGAGITQQPTLLNELYLGPVAKELPGSHSRAHFFGVSAHRMRQIPVEHARKPIDDAPISRDPGYDSVLP